MDINILTAQYLDQTRNPFSSQAPGALQSAESGAFEEMLKKVEAAQAAAESGSTRPALSGKSEINKDDKLYEVCLELETFLVKNLIKGMRDTVQKTKLIDTGFAGEMYEDMLYDEYAASFTKNANFGLAEMAYRQLSGTM